MPRQGSRREGSGRALRLASHVPSVRVWSTNCIAWSFVIVLSVETFSLLKTTPYALSQVAISSGRKAEGGSSQQK